MRVYLLGTAAYVMIDIHCHILPGIDDGAQSLETALEMAQMAVADGIHMTYCTPHIYPGLYENSGPDIQRRVRQLQTVLDDKGINLRLNYGADVHLVPEVFEGLRSGRVPTLGGSRYLLLEPSHHVRPPRFRESVFELIGAGFVPVITHPERLTWADQHLSDFTELSRSGAWLQITGGALLGRFGKKPQHLAEYFVGEGWADVLASDGHTTGHRAPVLAEALSKAEKLLGREEAYRLVQKRPEAIVDNVAPTMVSRPPALIGPNPSKAGKIRGRVTQWLRSRNS